MDWYLQGLRRYADFAGRSRRKEYWYFGLFNCLFTVLIAFVDTLVGTYSQGLGVGLLSGLYSLVIFIPSLSLLVRRLHDTGRSGWWVWIMLLPLIGLIVLLVFLLQDGESHENLYGADPKARPDLAFG
ncbi:MAG: DUF805 domain-containing protein [Myxococcota bacterium]|jgi:uncharacterized membrane protein YhaH (DUF805 family)|nr:DUF805 domain-containing protein [Myxococcota bacterium]